MKNFSITSHLKNSRLRSRTRQKPIRRRPKKRAMAGHVRRRFRKIAMAGQAQKRSPAAGGMSVYFKEAFDTPQHNKIGVNPALRGKAVIER